MDKKDRANKRRQDKHHKKPPVRATAGDKSVKQEPKPPVSEPLIVYDDHFSRRPIEPNWSRDRDFPPAGPDDSEDEDHQLHAADLEKLLQLPPSASGHFFLSTEKHWIDDDQPSIVSGKSQQQQYGHYFRIDSKQLNLSLATIPFAGRNGYPAELFSKRELDSMILKASYETKKYQDYCSKQPVKMTEPRVTPPVKCLIGPDALPPREDPPAPPQVRPPPPRPTPCLIGPMALPPELRHDPNVTGSYAATVDVVPIDQAPPVVEETAATTSSTNSKDEKEKSNTATKGDAAATAASSETKEDIQAWLDDILDS